jgi:hypothetical protein
VINRILTRSTPTLTVYKQLVDGPDSRSEWGLEHIVLVPRAGGGASPAGDERDGVGAVLEVADQPLEGAEVLDAVSVWLSSGSCSGSPSKVR